MAIEFLCSGCAALFVVEDVTAGRKGKCPKCAVVNVVPRARPAVQPAPLNGSANNALTRSAPPAAPPASTGSDIAPPAEPAPVTWVPPAKRKRWRLVSRQFVLGLLGILLFGIAIGGYVLLYSIFSTPSGSRPAAKR